MKQRLFGLDFFRGIALLLMISFHFCYDLEYFHIHNFHIHTNPFFLKFRIVIVSMFLFAVGISLVLVHKNGINFKSLKKRVVLLGAASLAITLVTFFIFPHSWVYFGVLHFILIASIVGIFFINRPYISLFLGIIILVLYFFGLLSMHPLFRFLAPILHLPYFTQDLVPFIPWFSVVLFGIAFASLDFHTKIFSNKIFSFQKYLSNLIRFLGQNSLAVYLLHQPILFGIFYLFT